MKITRAMLHEDLQPYYRRARLPEFIFAHKPLTRTLNVLLKRTLAGKSMDALDCDELMLPSRDGDHRIRTRVYRPRGARDELPVLLYLHGGGYITGNPEMSAAYIQRFVETRPCVVVAPDYRKAYEHPFPAGFDDCYDTLRWIVDNTAQLRAQPDKLIVAGHSAGGGLTAAVTLKARDTGDANIAFQMPFYPMIDDSQPDDPARHIDSPVWNSATNRVGWNAYLADLHRRGDAIPAYAAPARNTDYSGLPPAATFIGSLDPFLQETKAYVEALRAADVEVVFKQYDCCFHGFEGFCPKAPISKDALAFTFDSFADFYDRYI